MSIASKPVIANVSTEAIVDPNHIRDELHKQIFMYVDWKSSIEKMVQNSTMREKAKALGEKILSEEGTTKAVAHINQILVKGNPATQKPAYC